MRKIWITIANSLHISCKHSPQHKYNLRPSKKRSREPEKQEGNAPQVSPPAPDEGKGKLHPDPTKKGVFADVERNGPKGHTENEAHVLPKAANGKGERTESGDIEKAKPTFNF